MPVGDILGFCFIGALLCVCLGSLIQVSRTIGKFNGNIESIKKNVETFCETTNKRIEQVEHRIERLENKVFQEDQQ